MKGAILMTGEEFYTDMRRMLRGIKNVDKYNWLITDCVCSPRSAKVEEMLTDNYCFLSGEELLKIVKADNFQWAWAVICAFKPEIPLSRIIGYPQLPFADGYDGFWDERVTMQHPLAEMELVPYDSSLFLMIAKSYTHVKYFREKFPEALDLHEYNINRGPLI